MDIVKAFSILFQKIQKYYFYPIKEEKLKFENVLNKIEENKPIWKQVLWFNNFSKRIKGITFVKLKSTRSYIHIYMRAYSIIRKFLKNTGCSLNINLVSVIKASIVYISYMRAFCTKNITKSFKDSKWLFFVHRGVRRKLADRYSF